MKEVLCKESKELRCYILSAVLFFEGFKQMDDMTEIHGKMILDVLGLTQDEVERFPVPKYSQILLHLRPISNPEVRQWIIGAVYAPVLKSRRTDAQKAFESFCFDLKWDISEIKDSMKSIENLFELKPINSSTNTSYSRKTTNNVGCLFTLIAIPWFVVKNFFN